ncbi:MAG: DUF1206 domain-containing protein [Nocardioidaceae bacterium]
MSELRTKAEQTGRRVDDSSALDTAIRFGLVAYGVVYLLVGWLALQLAFGDQANASTKGAMKTLAEQPFGDVLVWAVAVGMFLLVLWRALEALGGHREYDGGDRLRRRVTSGVKAVIYAGLGVSAVKIALGDSGGSRPWTARLMDLPFGRWLVGAVGLGILAYGASLVVNAWTEKFRKHLDSEGRSGNAGKAYLMFGKVGYAAKGAAFGLIGGPVVYGAITHEPNKSAGLDRALQQVLREPFGPVLLVLIAVGIVCYGLFQFARARHLSR